MECRYPSSIDCRIFGQGHRELRSVEDYRKGKEFIKKPVSFKITEDNEFDEEEEEVPYAVEPPVRSILPFSR